MRVSVATLICLCSASPSIAIDATYNGLVSRLACESYRSLICGPSYCSPYEFAFPDGPFPNGAEFNFERQMVEDEVASYPMENIKVTDARINEPISIRFSFQDQAGTEHRVFVGGRVSMGSYDFSYAARFDIEVDTYVAYWGRCGRR